MIGRIRAIVAVLGRTTLAALWLCASAVPWTVLGAQSSRVGVVESATPSWSRGEGWRVSQTPVLILGVVEGDSNLQLYRVANAIRTRIGRIFVANSGSSQVLMFDDRGHLLKTIGRRGAGPREFNGIGWVKELAGDSVLVWDTGNQRLSLLTPDGEFVATARLPASGGVPRAVGAWPDGSVLAATTVPRGDVQESGLARDTSIYVRHGLDGQPIKIIGRFPGAEFYRIASGTAGQITVSTLAPPFGRVPQVAVGATGFYFGVAHEYEITQYDQSGTALRRIRAVHSNRRVTSVDIANFRDGQLRGIADDNMRRTQRRMLEQVEVPATMPAYGTMLCDDGGNLWVRDYRAFGDPPTPWQVFDPGGRLLGSVSLPDQFRPTQIGLGFVLGVWTDAEGVEFVRQYELIK